MTLNYDQLRGLANSKATEALAITEGDAPDMEAYDGLMKDAEGYKVRAERMKAAMTLAEETTPAAKTPTPLTVVADEADKAIKARPYTGLGEFLMDVKNAALGQRDNRLLSLRSTDPADEGGFSINGALGDEFVGGFTKSAFKQTGLNEGLGAEGGFLVDTDRQSGILQRVYDVGELLRRVDMVGISANSNGMTFNAVNETSRADGSRRGGIRAYWTAEGGTKTASQPAFRQLELKLRKVVGLVYATDELLQDANALESWIMQNLPEELRFVVEDAIINGTGTGMPQGLIGSAARVLVAKETGQGADTIVTANIVKMWSRMWAPSRRNAIWLINQDCEPQLMQPLVHAPGTVIGGIHRRAEKRHGQYALPAGEPVAGLRHQGHAPALGIVKHSRPAVARHFPHRLVLRPARLLRSQDAAERYAEPGHASQAPRGNAELEQTGRFMQSTSASIRSQRLPDSRM